MNILIYRYGSICEPDIIKGFETLGNSVKEITAEIQILKNELFAHNYDFVFSINFFPFISEVCNIFQIRYICWTVDCPVMELYSNSIRNPWNRIFMFDKAQYEEFLPHNQKKILKNIQVIFLLLVLFIQKKVIISALKMPLTT